MPADLSEISFCMTEFYMTETEDWYFSIQMQFIGGIHTPHRWSLVITDTQ